MAHIVPRNQHDRFRADLLGLSGCGRGRTRQGAGSGDEAAARPLARAAHWRNGKSAAGGAAGASADG